MQAFLEKIVSINSAINGFVWGPYMCIAIIAVGIVCTIGTKVFQLTKFGFWMRETFISIFKKKNVRKTKDKHAISQFQSLTTALAATVGTGNIVGVAGAIIVGGPGAVFWMWLSAFFGMMTNYAENTLGIKYRYKNEKGEWVGGAMIYIERGLHQKWLAVLFSIFCMFASFGIGNLMQINSISNNLINSFVPKTVSVANIKMIKYVIGIVFAAIVALVILGGIKRIASVTEKIVPFMVIIYIIGGIIILTVNFKSIPSAFGLIFSKAFTLKAGVGGAAGYVLKEAMRLGVARGVFSNEAGLGSSVMVHSASDVKEPVRQGMWGVFEVFADTIVVCTITALAILTSGYYSIGAVESGTVFDKASLTADSFKFIFGPAGSWFVAIALMFFAFSTILGWSYYGQRAVEYLFGTKATPVYKTIFVALIVVGAVITDSFAWDISDTFNGLMAIPNLIAVLILSPQVFEMTRDYLYRKKLGQTED